MVVAGPAQAQEAVSAPPITTGTPGTNVSGVEPSDAKTSDSNPSANDASMAEPGTEPAPVTTPGLEINPPVEALPSKVSSGRDLPAPATPPSQLFAAQLAFNGGVVTAEGTAENPVRFVTSAGQLQALRIQLDTVNQTVEAQGEVRLERTTKILRREIRARSIGRRRVAEDVTETLVGQNLHYDFKDSSGKLDNAKVQLSALTITTDSLLINGKRYTASNVVVRPGTLSDAEQKIYGTPPLNIRAKSVVAIPGATGGKTSMIVKGGGLFFRNTRIMPLPAYIFRAGIGGGNSQESAYSVTPGISLNSADNILVTTKVSVPLSKKPDRLLTSFDIGLSQRVGIRGGVGIESNNSLGRFALRARESDIVTTQLTNRIELDRLPEVTFRSHNLGLINMAGGRQAGVVLTGAYGDYAERTIGENAGAIRANRLYGRLLFTTRLRKVDGPFLDLFTSTARYSGAADQYSSRGFTVGYDGNLLKRVRGQIAYSSTTLHGNTPFRFDQIEIARELRSTFDVTLTPRYLLPVDLRYDLSRHEFRDKTFGILRSYKTFAYGVVYQSARRDLRLEVRQGF